MWFDVVAEVVHPLAGIVVNWLFLILLKLSSLVCGCFPLVGDVADILYVDMEFVDFVFLMSSFLGFFVLLFVYYC